MVAKAELFLLLAALLLSINCLASLTGHDESVQPPSMESPGVEGDDHDVVRGQVLMERARTGDFSEAGDLLQHGAAELFDHETGNTPLLYAIQHDDVDATVMLLEHGFNIFHVNHDGHNSLHLAAIRDNKHMIVHLLDYFLMRDDIQDYYEALDSLELDGRLSENVGQAILELSIHHEDVGLIMHAVSRGISVHTRSETGYTPLLIAVRLGDEVAVRELLQSGADPNDAENDGW